jgi:hypothetical protein
MSYGDKKIGLLSKTVIGRVDSEASNEFSYGIMNRL